MCLATTPTGRFGSKSWHCKRNIYMRCYRSLPRMLSAPKRCLVHCPAIAVENNVFMTSLHNSSFSAHWPCPGLHFELAIGSSATHQKSFDYRYYCITMKVSRGYICNLIQHRKTPSLYEKTLIGPKRAVFNFFQSSMGGGGWPPNPPYPVRTPLKASTQTWSIFLYCKTNRLKISRK